MMIFTNIKFLQYKMNLQSGSFRNFHYYISCGYSVKITVLLLMMAVILSNCAKNSLIGEGHSFVKFYGSFLSNTGNDVKQTADGGYVIIGTVQTQARGKDIFLVKTDKYGNQQWAPKYYGGSLDDNGYSLQITADGGYILAGSMDTIINGQLISKMFVIKTDGNGIIEWTKIIGGKKNDEAYFVQLDGNSGYLLAGYSESYGAGGKDAILVSLGLNGNVNWYRTYGGALDDDAKCVEPTKDGYILIGNTQVDQQSPVNIFIVKTNNLGLIENTLIIGGNDNITGESLQVLPDSGFIAVGTRKQSGITNSSIYLFRIENDISRVLWFKNIGGSTGADIGKSVKLTSDNGLAIIGTHGISENISNFYFVKTDHQGNELFSRFYGQSGLQIAENLEQTSDNGFIIIGTNNIEGNTMVTLVKIKTDGGL